jgi:glycine betaine/choline ABC-type transport system substrate-binding protein
MTKSFVTAVLGSLVLGLAACASQKEPAEQAMAAVEAKFKESAAEIQKYLPERYAELEQTVASLRESLAQKDYGDVVKGAAAAQAALKRSIADARVKRAQTIAAMDREWDELAEAMPPMISAMDKKISSQRGRPPKGMSRDEWKQTIADYDAARDAWSKAAATERTRANLEGMVVAARDAKAKSAAIMDKLEVKPS